MKDSDSSHAKLNRGGRPTVRCAETAKIICECIGLGVPYRHACAVARISYQSFCDWRKDDDDFREQVETALAEGVRRRLQVIQDSLESQDESVRLRASCWYLEHVHPQHFARNRIELTGADGQPLAGAVAIYLPQKEPLEKTVMEPNGNPKAIAEKSHERD